MIHVWNHFYFLYHIAYFLIKLMICHLPNKKELISNLLIYFILLVEETTKYKNRKKPWKITSFYCFFYNKHNSPLCKMFVYIKGQYQNTCRWNHIYWKIYSIFYADFAIVCHHFVKKIIYLSKKIFVNLSFIFVDL